LVVLTLLLGSLARVEDSRAGLLPFPVGIELAGAEPRWCATLGDASLQWMTLSLMGSFLPESMLLDDSTLIVPVQSETSGVVAFEASTGRVLWRVGTRYGRVFLADRMVGGSVIYGSSELGAIDLGAIDVSAGSEEWRLTLTGGLASPPVVQGDRVYIDASDGGVIAIDARSGRVVWRAESDLRPGPLVPVDGGMLVAGLTGGTIAGIDAATGRERWRLPEAVPGQWAHAGAHASGTVVLVSRDRPLTGYGSVVVAIDAVTGAERWRAEFPFTVLTSPAMNGTNVYVATSEGEIVAFDVETGGERWHWRGSTSDRSVVFVGSGPVLANGGLLIGGMAIGDGVSAGLIVSVDHDGSARWHVDSSGPSVALISGSDRFLFASYLDGQGAIVVCAHDTSWLERESAAELDEMQPQAARVTEVTGGEALP